MLREMHCVACRADSPRVTDAEMLELLPEIPEWRVLEVEGVKRLERQYKFKDFAGALAFTDRVGELANVEDHHPRLVTEWGKVTVDWWTHKIHGLHRNDFIMAARSDGIYGEMTGAVQPERLGQQPIDKSAT